MINIRKKHHEGTIKNGQSRDTGNIGHKTQNENKQPGGEPTCSRRTSSSCFLYDTQCVTHIVKSNKVFSVIEERN
jgi:hypothetical protein